MNTDAEKSTPASSIAENDNSTAIIEPDAGKTKIWTGSFANVPVLTLLPGYALATAAFCSGHPRVERSSPAYWSKMPASGKGLQSELLPDDRNSDW